MSAQKYFHVVEVRDGSIISGNFPSGRSHVTGNYFTCVEAAELDAEKLAKRSPGKLFAVLEVRGVVVAERPAPPEPVARWLP